jgi:hypothetical protein
LPHDPFEAASSLATHVIGSLPYIRYGGFERDADLAYGTVTVALAQLAAFASGFFGTADDILAQRTLTNYCTFQMMPPMREAFRQRVKTGQGVIRPSGRAPWMIATYPGNLVCPVCEPAAWHEYGTRAIFWPHRAPMVRACWRHGVQLVPMASGPEPNYPAECVREAGPAQSQFARDTVMLCQLGADCGQAAIGFEAQLAAAGVLRENGTYATAQFCRSFRTFCKHALDAPALQGVFDRPLFGQNVLHWVRCSGERYIAPLLLVLLLGWLRLAARSTAVSPLPAPAHPRRGRIIKRETSGWAGRYSVTPLSVDGRKHYGKADIERLLRAHCTYLQIATLCRMRPRAVHQFIADAGLRPLAVATRFAERRAAARRAWQSACQRHPGGSQRAIRKLEPRAYGWLVTNDKAWLLQQHQKTEAAKGWRRALLPTAGSAATIAEQVRQAGRTLSAASRTGRCSKAGLCRALGVTPYLLERWRSASPLIATAIKRALEGDA